MPCNDNWIQRYFPFKFHLTGAYSENKLYNRKKCIRRKTARTQTQRGEKPKEIHFNERIGTEGRHTKNNEGYWRELINFQELEKVVFQNVSLSILIIFRRVHSLHTLTFSSSFAYLAIEWFDPNAVYAVQIIFNAFYVISWFI